ncbi:MAG: asparagine synthetase B, partial [Euryarchaeota archaeon]|nr:asparagine synthetase B [Euryarchaeota archaeon]
MCGISIIIRKKDRDGIEEDIKSMNDLISHRGPDDEGYYFSDKIAFGHRRLSILDLSSAGQQPMHYLDKYVITYNGEIYNYLEI